MEIATKYFGTIEIRETDIINFDSGIPGFLDEKKFTIIPLIDTAFSIMQSITSPELAFVVTDPFNHFSTYEFKLPTETIETLQVQNEKDVYVLTILTVATPFNNTTANLKAPIIINNRTKQGKQIILNDNNYETKHLLVSKLPSKDKGE